MGWLYLIPQTLSALFKARTVTTDVDLHLLVILAPWVEQLQKVSNYLLVLLPLYVLALTALKGRLQVNPIIVTALAVAVSAAISSAIARGPLLTKPAFTLMMALFAAAFLPRGKGAAQGAAWFTVTFTIACCLLTLVNYSTIAVSCTGLYKCGPLGVFILGALQSENAFGLLVCAALPFVWLSFQGRAKVFLVGYMFFMTAVSSSRTSTYGAIGVFLLLVILAPSWSSPARKGRLYVAAIATFSAVVFGVILPFTTSDPHAYTNRGLVWLIARTNLEGHYAVGLGAPSWGRLVGINQLPSYASYSTHNQWLDVLWVAGVIGAFGIVAIIFKMMHDNATIAVAVLLPVVFLGLAERIWGLSTFDTWSFAYIAAMMAIPTLSMQYRVGWSLSKTAAVREAEISGIRS